MSVKKIGQRSKLRGERPQHEFPSHRDQRNPKAKPDFGAARLQSSPGVARHETQGKRARSAAQLLKRLASGNTPPPRYRPASAARLPAPLTELPGNPGCILTVPVLWLAPSAPFAINLTFKQRRQISRKALKTNCTGETERGRRTDRLASTLAVGAIPRRQVMGQTGKQKAMANGSRAGQRTAGQAPKPRHSARTWRSPSQRQVSAVMSSFPRSPIISRQGPLQTGHGRCLF